MKYTGINLQTLQDKDLSLTLQNNVRGDISTVMGDRFVKIDENKNILCMDASYLYGHSFAQHLPHDEIEKWHGHSDLHMNNLDEISNTPGDSNLG